MVCATGQKVITSWVVWALRGVLSPKLSAVSAPLPSLSLPPTWGVKAQEECYSVSYRIILTNVADDIHTLASNNSLLVNLDRFCRQFNLNRFCR